MGPGVRGVRPGLTTPCYYCLMFIANKPHFCNKCKLKPSNSYSVTFTRDFSVQAYSPHHDYSSMQRMESKVPYRPQFSISWPVGQIMHF